MKIALMILRAVFIVLSVAAALGLSQMAGQFDSAEGAWSFYGALIWCVVFVAAAVGFSFLDRFFTKRALPIVAAVIVGLLVGALISYAVGAALELVVVGDLRAPAVVQRDIDELELRVKEMTPGSEQAEAMEATREALIRERQEYRLKYNIVVGLRLLMGLVICYLVISFVIRTRDNFRFVIPYVEFAKEVKGQRPMILDTSVIIDGRIADVVETKIITAPLVIPRFVLQEIHNVSDSADKLKRNRGRRGLDMLNRLQTSADADVRINETVLERGEAVDEKLVELSTNVGGVLVTNDFNLNKLATLQGVDVININDLAQALRPVILPGENMNVKVVKPGEGYDQGVGYLDDGTMVVVEHGRGSIGNSVNLVVTSLIQTSAGRMIFGRIADSGDDESKKNNNHRGGGSSRKS